MPDNFRKRQHISRLNVGSPGSTPIPRREGLSTRFPPADFWRNRVESGELLRGAYVNKADAVEAGRREARRRETEHVIHNRDGTIAKRTSYGRHLAQRAG